MSRKTPSQENTIAVVGDLIVLPNWRRALIGTQWVNAEFLGYRLGVVASVSGDGLCMDADAFVQGFGLVRAWSQVDFMEGKRWILAAERLVCSSADVIALIGDEWPDDFQAVTDAVRPFVKPECL